MLRWWSCLLLFGLLFAPAALRAAVPSGGSAERCRQLKQSLSPAAQAKLAAAGRLFEAALAARPKVSSGDVRSVAQSSVRQSFPGANGAQVNLLAAVVLADWQQRQQPEIARLQAAARAQRNPARSGRGSSGDPGTTDNEAAMIRLNDLIARRQLVDALMTELLTEQDETTANILDHF